jgi:O-antigen/teichoic acid export membrane protein
VYATISKLASSLFKVEEERTDKLTKNIIASIAYRAISTALGLLMVPVMLNSLTPVKYGIWLTLSSTLAWITFFDIGLGNGLRNKLAEAIARHDTQLARTYVSTAYAAVIIIAASLLLLFLICKPMLNWTWILNAPTETASEVDALVFIVVTFVLLRFIFSLLNAILAAEQNPSYISALDAATTALSLIAVLAVSQVHNGSLLWFGGVVACIGALVPFIASLFFFLSTPYNEYRPSVFLVRAHFLKDLVNLGIKFFLLQTIYIIIFATDNLIITHLFGPAEVTPYNIAFRYFNLIVMVFSIVTTPFWSAFTDAYTKDDFGWIRRAVSKVVQLWVAIAIVTVGMLVWAQFFYEIWIGTTVTVPFSLSLTMCIFALLTTWNSVFTMFVNGIGKIRLQLVFALTVGILNIPLSIVFAKYLAMDSAGVMVATIICLLPGSLLTPIQYHKIMNRTATGIWNQ